MRFIFVLTFLICTAASFAQTPYEYFNGKEFWSKIKVDEPGVKPIYADADTTCIVASTRILQKDSFRSIGELRDENIIRYYFVYSSHGNWHLVKTNSLSEAIRYLPSMSKDWVIYTEGMGKMFTSDLDRGMQMAAQYNVNVLLLDYPSIRADVGSIHNYKFAIRNARIAYKDFVPVLDSFKILRKANKLGSGHLSLFFHSMGNNVMREIVKHNLVFMFNGEAWVDNLVLNAPCVQRKKHKQWVDQINFAKRIYIIYNAHDGTLKWARLAGFHQILGEHVKKPISSNAIYINFNKLCGADHSNFVSLYSRSPIKPEAKKFYGDLLHGININLNDNKVFAPSGYRHIGLDIMPNN
jgi:hypothetical protein